MPDEEDREPSFFEKERDRLAAELTSNFEELLSSSNVVNRRLEAVLGVDKEFKHIASLWQSFEEMVTKQKQREQTGDESEEGPAWPGTGGHVVNVSASNAVDTNAVASGGPGEAT